MAIWNKRLKNTRKPPEKPENLPVPQPSVAAQNGEYNIKI
jgi:hypothetical protein